MVRVRYVEKKERSFPNTSDDAYTIQRLLGFVICIEAGVSKKEVYGIVQVVHLTLRIRSKLTMAVLSVFLDTVLPPESEVYYQLSSHLRMPKEDEDEDDMDVDTATSAAQGSTSYCLPEVEIYCYLLLLLFFIDRQLYDEAKECSIDGIARIQSLNRTVDVLTARVYFYYSLSHELTNSLFEIRSNLLALHRVAILRNDELGQETLLNLLLRNYLHYNLYDQAEKLSSKAPRLEAHSNQQFCRYLFYLGKIKTIQLEYTDAKESLLQASRKAPVAARGFLITCNKWIIIVRLLLGEIPEKAIFTQKGMKNALVPYFDLAKAVRIGDFKLLQTVTEKYSGVFRRDRTHNLIVRVRKNVIRTGLRNISICYSRISLADVARKLQLNSDNPVVDAESIVSKAIRDGVIDAKIDFVNCWMLSKVIGDGYSTKEPQLAFNSRIDFCLNMHNKAVRALRFPPNYKKETKIAKRQQQCEALSTHIEEDDDDEYYF